MNAVVLGGWGNAVLPQQKDFAERRDGCTRFHSTQSGEQTTKLLVQAVVRKELSERVTFTDISLFPWLLGTKLSKEVESATTSALHYD